MSAKTGVETLFKEHSFEEIETLRDNLAAEIEKRTELLKSIVKEKYHDIIETSDAIHSMKLNLNQVEKSVHNLDKDIEEFYTRLREPNIDHCKVADLNSENAADGNPLNQATHLSGNISIEKLIQTYSELWDHFDRGDLKSSVKSYMDSIQLLNDAKGISNTAECSAILDNLTTNLDRAREMIKNHIWHRVKSAEPNQIGVIAGSDESDLYQLSVRSSVEFLVENLRKDLSDMSYQAQIRRYQPWSYFNTQTNLIDPNVDDLKPPPTGYVQIPKVISIELSRFLYDVCRVINTIAGFSLTRSSILESLKTTLEHILVIYTDLIPLVQDMKSETRRKRALQLYYDLLYIRVLLNTSKHLDIVEELDPKVHELLGKYELMLDSIELYMVSESLHNNVLSMSRSITRLYGLLIPYLQ